MGFRFNARPQILRKLMSVIFVFVAHEHARESFRINHPIQASERPLRLPGWRLIEFGRLRPAVGKDQARHPVGELGGIPQGNGHASEK